MNNNQKFIKTVLLSIFLLWSLLSLAKDNANPNPVSEEKTASAQRWYVQHWKTPTGIPVYFIENHVLPMVDIQVIFKAGSAYDGQQYGLANLTNSLLNQGTKQASVEDIAENWDMAGASYSAVASRDMAVVGIRSLTYPKQLTLALSTLKEVLSEPAFSTESFYRTQKQLIQLVKHQEQKPDVVATHLFYKTLYGQHPYAHPVVGDSTSLNRLKPEDTQKFYQNYYTADNAMITIVGNFTLEEAKKVSIALTQSLKRGASISSLPAISKNQSSVQHVNFPSNQTHLLIGQIALSRSDPDYFPLITANYILGGDMNSKLFKTIRGENGLAYNVTSGFAPTQEEGPFYVKLQTEGSQTQKAIDLSKKVLLDFIKQGPSKKELAAAQQYLVQNFILKLSSNQAISAALTEIAFYGLPLEYLNTYQDKIKSVSQDQVQKALEKHLFSDRFVQITTGKDG